MAAVRSAVAVHKAPWFDPAAGETVLVAEQGAPGYWVGAPSVVAGDDGRVLLSYRRRRPRDGSADERGHLAAIAESTDGGRTFADIWRLSKHDVGTSSLERFCLRRQGAGRAGDGRDGGDGGDGSEGGEGGWHLYTSWEDPPSSDRWRIDMMQAPSPDGFSLSSAVPVLVPGDVRVDAVKDPYVVVPSATGADKGATGPGWLMYVSTFLTPRGPAPTSIASSPDGRRFSWEGTCLAVGQGWDAYQARISSVMPFGTGFVGYYDGAASPADDTEEHCGLATSTDLRIWHRLSSSGPVVVSPHGTGSLRYVEAVPLGGEWWAYYEYARPDGSHELRRNLLSG